MASIHREIVVSAPADAVWDAIRDVGNAHLRVFPGVLTEAHIEGETRVATFANGLVVRELIVDLDDTARRFAYSSQGGRLSHHNSSLQVFEDENGSSRVAWITDLLPNSMVDQIAALVDAGTAVMKKALDGATASASS